MFEMDQMCSNAVDFITLMTASVQLTLNIT